jgi:hypothetical protein
MDKFLDTDDHPKLNQEDINHLNRSITHNETEAAKRVSQKKKSLGPGFSAEFYQTFTEKYQHFLTFSMKEKEKSTA